MNTSLFLVTLNLVGHVMELVRLRKDVIAMPTVVVNAFVVRGMTMNVIVGMVDSLRLLTY
jgi:hypothetical protein